jgi:hypothetical protein
MQTNEESITNLEEDLGIPSGFYVKLREESDWSFIIKLHALIECAVAEQLTRTFRRPELADVFSRLELSNSKTGKIALIGAMNLLPKPHIVFIQKLSELRNQLAHNVKNVSLDLADFFKRMKDGEPDRLKALAGQLLFAFKLEGEKFRNGIARFSTTFKIKAEGGPNITSFIREDILLWDPKNAIWFNAVSILDAISLCNRYGPQMWSFLVECDDQKDCEDWVHELFGRAKVGDRELPEQMARKFEQLMPHVRVARDVDGQPILASLAAALNERKKQIVKELLDDLS